MEKSSTFDQLLNVFWLRPETALWREIDIQAMRGFTFESPSLDIGCGDGVFSFIRAGGEFRPEFDAFKNTAALDKFFEKADVFDAYDESFNPLIQKSPGYQIDQGFDHKENLLKKAGQLKLYKEVMKGDGNQLLPFQDDSIKTIFSNILYWLDDPLKTLKEIRRILMDGGRVCLMLPNNTLPEFSFYNQLFVKTGDSRWSFLDRLDRGRFTDNIRQAKSAQEWESLFKLAGLNVVDHKRHLSRTIVQLWDIGLRPLFPTLLKMSQAVPPNELTSIKQEWVETVGHFLKPLASMDDSMSKDMESAFHCYILQK